MKTISKVGLVIGGYLAAFLLAVLAVIASMLTAGPEAQASSGMSAFGDALLFVFVFAVTGSLPTAAALFFLRHYRPFWVGLSLVVVFTALMSAAAAVVFAIGRQVVGPSPLAAWADFSVLIILASPLFAVAFAVCGFFSPQRLERYVLFAAALIELMVCAYGGFVWLLPPLLS
jgi:hypothetical protein